MIRKKPSGPCRMSLLAAFFFCAGTALASAGMTVVEQPNRKGDKAITDKILKIEDSAMEQWRQGNPMKWAEISGDEIICISRTPWNCTEVYAKAAGEWKIVHTHWSYINGQREDSGV